MRSLRSSDHVPHRSQFPASGAGSFSVSSSLFSFSIRACSWMVSKSSGTTPRMSLLESSPWIWPL